MKLPRVQAMIVVALLASAAGASAETSRASSVETVVLTIHHSHFSMSELRVKRGQKVRFVVHNTDPIDHELIVGPMDVQLMHEFGRRRWHPPIPGEVSVRLLSTAETTYTFSKREPILFGCHLPGHWNYGMHGRIIVS